MVTTIIVIMLSLMITIAISTMKRRCRRILLGSDLAVLMPMSGTFLQDSVWRLGFKG